MAKSPSPATSFAPYPAPNFSLPNSTGGTTALNDLKGQWTVLFLYPTDNTPTCTQEACDFSVALPDFEAAGIKLYGLSKDSLKDHSKFILKYGLKMPLLSDESTQTIDAFGSWGEKSLYGRKYMGTDRSTFLIDPQGFVRHVWRKVKVKGHVTEVLTVAKSMLN